MSRSYTKPGFIEALKIRVSIYDGAMVNNLQAQGLYADHFGGDR